MYERARRSNGKFEEMTPSGWSGPGWWRPGGPWPGGGRRWGRRRCPGWSRGPPGSPGRPGEGKEGLAGSMLSIPLDLSSKESILKGVLVGECFNRVSPLDLSNIFAAITALLLTPLCVLLFWQSLGNWSWSCPRRWLPHFSRVLVSYWSSVASSLLLIGRPITAWASPAPVTAVWWAEAEGGNFQKFEFVICRIIRTKLHDSLYQMLHLSISYQPQG